MGNVKKDRKRKWKKSGEDSYIFHSIILNFHKIGRKKGLAPAIRNRYLGYILFLRKRIFASQAVKTDNKLLFENKGKFVLVHSSSGYKHALKVSIFFNLFILLDPLYIATWSVLLVLVKIKILVLNVQFIKSLFFTLQVGRWILNNHTKFWLFQFASGSTPGACSSRQAGRHKGNKQNHYLFRLVDYCTV